MKLLDIVNQIKTVLPSYTDLISDTLSVSSITASGGVATIVTSTPHNLIDGDAVTLVGVLTQTPITAVSKDGNIYTFTTGTAHDITETWEPTQTPTLTGFTDPSWNGDFTLSSAINRKTFAVTSANALPVLNGSEILLENRVDGPNGMYGVTVIDPTTFTVSGNFTDGSYVDGTIHTWIRVAGAVDFQRAIEQYTEQNLTDLWAFVVMHDTEVSKDRNTLSDALATPGNGVDLRLRTMGGFSVYLVKDVTEDIAAQNAVDVCRHDMLLPMLKSLYGARFTTGLTTAPDFKTIFTGHGVAFYDKARYAHVYNFQVSMDLTDSDAVAPSNTRAYRDTNYTQESSIGADEMSVIIDQDDVPLTP